MIYLNNASTTFPKPKSVLNAVSDFLVTPPANFGRTGLTRGDKNIINDCRALVKDFFNTGDDYHAVFTSGSTESLNTVIKGLDLAGKNILISATEHNSVIRPLKEIEKDGKITISIASCDDTGLVNIDELESLITENTALICINQCSNVTGTVQDITRISQIAQLKDALLLVDGSQSSGVMNVDLKYSNPDFFCFTGHKSLYGLQGTGGLIFKKTINLKSFKQGGTGTLSHILTQPEEFPYKYEAGTMNIPAITALEAGIKWIVSIGLENIINHKKNLINILIEGISKINGSKLYFNNENSSGSILSFNFEGIPPEDINYILSNSFDISLRSGIHCAPLIHKYLGLDNSGTLRASPSYFTTVEEIEMLSIALNKIASKF